MIMMNKIAYTVIVVIDLQLKKCIRNVDACSNVLGILKDDVKDMHQVHEKCVKIQQVTVAQ